MAQVNICIDDGLKENDITTHTDPFYSDNNMRVLRQSIAYANAGKLTEHDLIEV
jgi:hypothetical protein